MRKGVQAVQVVNKRGATIVQAMGRTARGVKFIIAEEVIPDLQPRSKDYKEKITAAADRLLGSEA